jgi:transcriptional regulator with XRE-family HTH domain
VKGVTIRALTIRAGTKLTALLARINRATAQRGTKTELAKYLGVSRQRVTNWLSLDSAPNGEITLQMLEWVQAREAKKRKALGSAINTAKSRKTRSTKSSYEKSQSSPPRK